MLKRLTNGEFVLAMLVASLFWISVIAWATTYAPTDKQKDACYQSAAKAGRGVDECKSFWEKTTSDPIAAFTLVLAVSTVGLWIATIGLYFAGEKQIEVALKAANAAELSAKAAVAIELPVITAFPQFFRWGKTHHHCSVNHVTFYNHGRTDAYLAELKCGWITGANLPTVPFYQFTELISVERILKQNTSADVRTEKFEFAVSADFFDRMRANQVKLWFFCCLVYTDFLQNTHEACFCWERWQRPGDGGFNVDTTEAYNRKT
jgi:hypothetical protein